MSGPEFPAAAADWLRVDEAVARILAAAEPLPPRHVPLSRALGHVLAQNVDAAFSLPPWPNAGMDGYALRASELEAPGTFPVTGEVRAGDPWGDAPPPGSAVRIMTGAPVPRGMDSVVRVEDTDAEQGAPDRVEIRDVRDRGRNVRPAGEDMRQGERLLDAGQRLTPGRIALLASSGTDPVAVVPLPRVGILPTGDELRTANDLDDVRRGIAIPESNGPTLAAACAAMGAESVLLPPVPDDPGSLREALTKLAGEADLVLTLGGASMGTADLVKRVLDRMGFELDFWRVAMRPGSPFSFGWLPGEPRIPVFGLPGNPASAFVTFQLLVRPYLRRVAGHTELHRPVVQAVTGASFSWHPERTIFHRVILEEGEERVAQPTGPQGSGLVRSLGRAQGLAVVAAGAPCPPGTAVPVILLDDAPETAREPGYFHALRASPEPEG